jgi:hypothetical protein
MKLNLFGILIFLFISLAATAQYQLENPSFEEWEDVGLPVEEPVDWSSIKTNDNPVLNGPAPIVWGKSNDAHSGNYSLHLFNVYIGLIGQAAVGTMTNGRVHADLNIENAWSYTDTTDARWNTPLTHRPDSLVGWFKCYPETGDFGTVKAVLHRGYGQQPEGDSEWIGAAYYELPGDTVDVWTRFSVPFEYYLDDTPEYILCYMTSGDGVDALGASSALFDDLELIYNPDGIEEFTVDNFKAYSSHGQLVVRINESSGLKYQFSIYDITGRNVYNAELFGGQENRLNTGLTTGIYILKANIGDKVLSKKIVIN